MRTCSASWLISTGALHFGTVDAVLNEDYVGDGEEAHNTYRDGRAVMLQTRIEPLEESDFNWEHNRFLLDEGAVFFHRRGTTCNVSPINPGDEWGWAGASF